MRTQNPEDFVRLGLGLGLSLSNEGLIDKVKKAAEGKYLEEEEE